MGKISKKMVIMAPIEEVWKTISDFHDMVWAPNVITSLEVAGDAKGSELGARRILNGVFYETLIAHDPIHHVMQYCIDEGPSPVSSDEISHYIATITLKEGADGNSTLVEWSSKWAKNDEPVAEFCGEMYDALLNEMKKMIESN